MDFDDLPVHPRLFENPEISGDPLDRPFIHPDDYNQQANIEPDSNYNYHVITQNAPPKEEEREFRQQPKSTSLSDADDSPEIDLGIDWDSPEVFERRLMREIFKDKKERARNFQLMELETQRLIEERQRLERTKADIEKQNNELKSRQEKLKDIESFIPSVKELQG